MRLELHDAEQQPAADHPLSGVRVIVDGDLRQGETTDGLTFGLVVSNVGTTRVTLQRPDDGILLRVIDSNDRPVPIVMPLPAALVNTKDRPDPFAATEVIRLEQGENYKTTFLIRTVRVGSEQSRLAAGIYRVRVTVLLLVGTPDLPRDQSHRVFQSDEFTVHYGA